MAPNFCSNCGHRIYQHNAKGCEHVEGRRLVGCPDGNACTKPDRYAVPSGGHEHPEPLVCDCRQPHPLMIGAEA